MARRSDLQNGTWTRDELEGILERASPFVRHFLWEVSQHTSIPSADINSPNAAAAILKRIANNAGKEPLLLRSDHTGQPTYSLNPNYRTWIAELVSDANELPQAKPRKVRTRKVAARTAAPAATTTAPSATTTTTRTTRKTRKTRARSSSLTSITMPEGIDLEFCRELAEFLNSPPQADRYRIILDDDQLMLEKA